MINKIDLRKAISSIAISNAKRNTIYKAFSDLDSITKEEFDSVKSDISKVVESMLTKDTVGKANGVASLDSNGSVPIEQLGNIDTTLFLIVRELPTDDIKSNKIYLVPNQNGQGDNVYIEYLYVENVWEKLGEFKPDIDYNEILSRVEEKVISIDNNNNINGSFYYDDDDNLVKSTFDDYNRNVVIGLNGNIDNYGEQCVCVGYGNTCNGLDSIAIGDNIFSYDNNVCIGRDIVGSIDGVVLGALFITDESDNLDGRISIGNKVRNTNIPNVIYQIGGYNNNDSESRYNLEETLDYDNDHKKYIYGIGNYNGTTTDDTKSLQEVLEDKIETVYSYGSKQYLFRIDTTDDVISIIGDTTSNTAMLFFGTDNDTEQSSAVGITRTNMILRADGNYINIAANGIHKNDGSNTTVFATDGTFFDLTTKADASSIPTKTSQLTNDSNFATERYVDNSVSIFKTISVINHDGEINGLFNSNGERIDANSLDSKSIIIGFANDEVFDFKYYNIVSIGNNVKSYGADNVCIGNDIETDCENNIIIGKNINSNFNNNIIIGSCNLVPTLEGYIGIGYDICENPNAIYQIAGHGNDTKYNLEETLNYNNKHKKYIYGVGGYDGTNSNTEGIKSLQEVLADKADVSTIPTKLSQLTNDVNFITSYTETDPVWTSEKDNYYTKTEIDNKGYLTAHQSLDGCVKVGNDTTPAQLFKGQGIATINNKQIHLESQSGAVNITPEDFTLSGLGVSMFKVDKSKGIQYASDQNNVIRINKTEGIYMSNVSGITSGNPSNVAYRLGGGYLDLNDMFTFKSKVENTFIAALLNNTAPINNITDATTADEVVTKFNQLLKSLKAIGLMKPDSTAK